jgi:hypothetical protein
MLRAPRPPLWNDQDRQAVSPLDRGGNATDNGLPAVATTATAAATGFAEVLRLLLQYGSAAVQVLLRCCCCCCRTHLRSFDFMSVSSAELISHIAQASL